MLEHDASHLSPKMGEMGYGEDVTLMNCRKYSLPDPLQ